MKYKLLYFLFSLLFILPGIYFLLRFGLSLSVDFTGGSLVEFQVNASLVELRQLLEVQVPVAGLQQSNDSFVLRTKELSQAENQALQVEISSRFGQVQEKRFETIGPTLGKELIKKTLVGILLAAGFILSYVAYRFHDKKYGVCAVLAMLHDSLIMLGVFSFLGVYFQVEVDALFVTAMLTILSFSVHDTIVVYDRIRESGKLFPKLSFVELVNKAVTETLGRSLNNSLTIIFMLLALYLLGGDTTKWFVFALLIGTASGTYSSTFTAVPLLVLWEDFSHHFSHPRGVIE
ncbi:MAG: SecF protein [Candidatus Beckwithbacteria bacterium GW2011_GWA2_43_10]|uniref:Protein-export membrane protein SecF n=1 Tax=Candidatus Beckwithbacteria bacterium GW2011_GWA2_43_10 TaxID=1618369 RepID=A0A0G1C4Q2_9BACT|nr:MAG: SecF protein [Candidatus Beckwithbacteria bacterium GW2011_GWA2_43_10]